MPGSRLGDGCILGEGTLIPPGMVVPPHTVVVGRPPHSVRTTTEADRARVAVLRDHQLELTDHPAQDITGHPEAGAGMGRIYAYRDKTPTIDESVTLFDSAEITGDVVIGAGSVIGAGVKIIGDSHGPVRIGARVQILENTVLHLLPDNELIVDDDVVIGPGSMIHGCHIGAGSVVEVGAIVCDWSRVGPGSIVRAGACVKQRSEFPALAVIDGFPATQVATLDSPPDPPAWAFTPSSLATLTSHGA
jgi:carbonic anhydrase/acetyltransferase-like protein (isoleucine patch superfamily)